MVELRTLGRVDLRDADGRDIRAVLAQPKRLVLLVYLALSSRRGFRSRDTILALFWPELDDTHARGALSQAWRFLRKNIGRGAFLKRGDDLAVDLTHLRCDAVAFEQACDSGDYERASALYGGEFLDGVFVSDAAPELDSWIDAERARLRRLAVHAEQELAERSLAAGNVDAAVRHSRDAIRLSPDDEAAQRRLIAALAQSGERAAARRAYDDFAGRLAREYQLEPSRETLAACDSTAVPRATNDEPDRSDDRPPTPAARRPSRMGRRTSLAGLALLVAIVSVAIAARSRSSDSYVPNRMVVARFENHTGDSALAPLGDIVADWVSHGLAETDVVQVVDVRSELGRADKETSVRALAHAVGAGSVVAGSYYRQRDSILILASVVDGRSGRVLRAFATIVAPSADPLPGVDLLRQRIMSAVAAAHDVKLEGRIDDASKPPTYAAYSEFVAGQRERWQRIDRRAAMAHFRRAFQLDSTFTLAAVWAAGMHVWLGEYSQADSLLTRIAAAAAQLSPLERTLYDRIVASFLGDREAGVEAARRAARMSPGSSYIAFALATRLLNVNRPREALDVLGTIDPNRGWLSGEVTYWSALTMALHLVGDHRRELRAALRAREGHPTELRPLLLEARALAAAGRSDETLERIQSSFTLRAEPQLSHADVAQSIALELSAHGDVRESALVLGVLLHWLDDRSAAEKRDDHFRAERARTLYLAGIWEPAQRSFDSLAAEHPDSLSYFGYRGVLAAKRGDSASARAIFDSLVALHRPYLRGQNTLWAARIAAALGDAAAAALLGRALKEGVQFGREVMLEPWLHADPEFQPLAASARFQALVSSRH